MLLYLVKFSTLEISNAVREAAKANIRPTKAHMKSLYRLIKFVTNTKNHMLAIDPMQPAGKNVWEIIAYSDYAMDKDGRKSVTGFVIYILGCLVR